MYTNFINKYEEGASKVTSVSYKPGINNVSITNIKQHGNEVVLNKNDDNKILINFTLIGMNKLRNIITNDLVPFHLYIFLTYQHGGRDTEVITSSHHYCNEEILDNNYLEFSATLSIPSDKVFDNYDFKMNFYSLKIAYFERTAEDGSDLNFLLNNPYNSLFETKINVVIAGD